MIEELDSLNEINDIVEACGLDSLPPLNPAVFHCYSDEKRRGFAYISVVADEAELIDIAVRENCRGNGLGEELLIYSIDCAKKLGACSMYLEVRAGNETAQNLYKKLDFEVVGKRNAYYNNGEDAVLMRKLIYD